MNMTGTRRGWSVCALGRDGKGRREKERIYIYFIASEAVTYLRLAIGSWRGSSSSQPGG
jgi:hypothetical protein